MTLEHIRLFLNKHMKRKSLWFVTRHRSCCYTLCGKQYKSKTDLYTDLCKLCDMMNVPLKGAKMIVQLWLCSEYEVDGETVHETVQNTTLTFEPVKFNKPTDHVKCTMYCNGKSIELDTLDAMFTLAEQDLLPGKPSKHY